MRPRKRVRDLQDMILNPDDEEDTLKFRVGNIDLEAAINAKLEQHCKGEDQDTH